MNNDNDDGLVISVKKEYETPQEPFYSDEGINVSEIHQDSFVFDEKIIFIDKEEFIFITYDE